ncbi:peroxiredoxin [Archaeoglobus veneficus]|uniref:thioredoxin-dependent peroxiredoxin n=1 Tax=Archaeoglobus veneficus (strain DSM 11195 / SNP6) TaxID=693661 RepID=F2KR02_ARCVS|nr:peroxiredoxin [Archaeoglobus veneficus]AEA47808.1 alkyl hydroperoxide reductase/ Thiol specific antioxidant/ Mal allergen [Archaeoglobus veneficus SNP6]
MEKAVDFEAETQLGKIKIGELKKWVVLYFYPKDNTPGCTKEAKSFNELLDEFEKLNAAVIGVSTQSVESHKKFAEKLGLRFPLVADVNKKISSSYGVLKENGKTAKRTTFLIDPEMNIVKVWKNVKVDGHAEDVLKTLKDILS